MNIPENVLRQVQAALDTALGITLVHAPDQNAAILAAASALSDAINSSSA